MSVFHYGMAFLMDEKEYIVKKVDEGEIELELLVYQKRESWLMEDLLQAWNDGRITFQSIGTTSDSLQKDVDSIPKEKRFDMERRYHVLKPYLNGEIPSIQLNEYIKSQGISRSTFFNWKKKWLWAKDIRYLITNKEKRGPKDRRLAPEVRVLIEQIIKTLCYKGPKFTMKQLHRELKLQLDEVNEFRPENEKLKTISYDTFTRVYKEHIDIYRLSKIKDGKTHADLERFGSQGKIPVSGVLERIELDWTKLDLLVVDPLTGRRFRVWIILAVDVFSGCILGFYLTEKVDTAAIKQCILHCFMPKTYLKKQYPKVQMEWPAFGIPQEIIVDNAKANESYDLQDACLAYGIDIQYCTIASGHQKGSVERIFRSLNQAIIHSLPGTTFSNTREKGQYDSNGEACISLQALNYILHIAIVDILVNGWSQSRSAIPAKLWEKNIKENPELQMRLPRNKRDLQIVLGGGLEYRKVSKTGIRLAKLNFQSDALMDLKYEMLRKGDKNEDVKIRFDMSDMRTVFVWDRYKEVYIEAYTDNPTLENLGINTELPVPWDQIASLSAEQLALKKAFDDSHYAIAFREAHEIAADEKKALKKRLVKDQSVSSASATEGYPLGNLVNEEIDNVQIVHSVHVKDETHYHQRSKHDEIDTNIETLDFIAAIDFVENSDELLQFDLKFKGDEPA